MEKSLIKIGPYGTGCEKEGGVETEVRERKKRMLRTFLQRQTFTLHDYHQSR